MSAAGAGRMGRQGGGVVVEGGVGPRLSGALLVGSMVTWLVLVRLRGGGERWSKGTCSKSDPIYTSD